MYNWAISGFDEMEKEKKNYMLLLHCQNYSFNIGKDQKIQTPLKTNG